MWAPQTVVELMRSKLGAAEESAVSTSKPKSAGKKASPFSAMGALSQFSQYVAAGSAVMAWEETEKKLNPFQTMEHINVREWIKLILGALVVAPLRFFIIFAVISIGTVFMTLTVAGADVSKPLSPRRGFAQQCITAVCGYLICACMGVYRIRVKGKHASAEECKMIIVAPHSTVMDAVILAYACRGPSSVGKIEMSKTFVGPFLNALQTIYVDRSDKFNRSSVAAQIRDRVGAASKWRRQLMIFPEGTCTNRTSLISFRRGAFEPCAPVQPVVLHWSYTNFDPTWCAGAPSRTLVVLRTLSQVFHEVTVEFLPVYKPNEEECASAALFSENVRQLMAASLNIPTSDHSYEDMFLAQVAAKNKLKPCSVLPFTYSSLRQKLPPAAAESPRLFERVRGLLLCFAKAPLMSKQRPRLDQAQFEAIAPIAAAPLDIKVPLAWDQVSKDSAGVGSSSAASSGTVNFLEFALAHLKAASWD